MKRFLLVVSIYVCALSIYAKGIEYKRHGYLPCDGLIKEQVEYKDPMQSGVSVTWDFSVLTSIGAPYVVRYIGDSLVKSHITGIEHRTRYSYAISDEGIFCRALENATSLIRYKSPVMILPFGLSYGGSFRGDFEGEGEYGDGLPQYVKGTVVFTIDGKGTLKLPSGIFTDVFRVKSEKIYKQLNNVESIVTQEQYLWYSKQYRYPLFESIKTTYRTENSQDTIAFYTSFHYSSESQKKRAYENGEDYLDTENVSSKELAFTDVALYPNPVQEHVQVRFQLQEAQSLSMQLYSETGALVYENASRIYEVGDNSLKIYMGNMSNGKYSLVIRSNEDAYTYLLIKK